MVQDLAFSSKNAKDDIDSYFDSMQPETHKYSHHHQHDKSDADEVQFARCLVSSLMKKTGLEPRSAPGETRQVQEAES